MYQFLSLQIKTNHCVCDLDAVLVSKLLVQCYKMMNIIQSFFPFKPTFQTEIWAVQAAITIAFIATKCFFTPIFVSNSCLKQSCFLHVSFISFVYDDIVKPLIQGHIKQGTCSAEPKLLVEDVSHVIPFNWIFQESLVCVMSPHINTQLQRKICLNYLQMQ